LKFVGVDLAWGFKRPSFLCVLQYEGNNLSGEGFYPLVSLEDFAAFFAPKKDLLWLAIDAPLRVEDSSGNRLAEKEVSTFLRPFREGILPVNRTIIARKYPLLPIFWGLLEQCGFCIQPPLESISRRLAFEVFPPLIILGLWGAKALQVYRESKKRKEPPRFLEMVKEKKAFPPPFFLSCLQIMQDFLPQESQYAQDALDAFLCAYAAFFISIKGKDYTYLFGLPEGGCIVMPLRYPKSALANLANAFA